MTFELLPSAILKLREKIHDEVAKATNNVAFEVLRVAASRTPVDTSKAISNWQISIGFSANGVKNAYYEGSRGSTEEASLQEVYARGKQELVGRKVGQVIHIVNNAEYIDDLNNGKATSKPGLFVEAALAAGRIAISNTKLKLY